MALYLLKKWVKELRCNLCLISDKRSNLPIHISESEEVREIEQSETQWNQKSHKNDLTERGGKRMVGWIDAYNRAWEKQLTQAL